MTKVGCSCPMLLQTWHEKLAPESLERNNSYYLLIYPRSRSLFTRHSINTKQPTQSSFCLKKWRPRYETRDSRWESTRKQWDNAGWRVRNGPSTEQPSTTKDVVAKGRLTSESEEKPLQLKQNSTIKFYSAVMFSRFSGFDWIPFSKNYLLARQKDLNDTCTGAANCSVVKLGSKSDAQPVVTSQDSNWHQCH